MTREQKEWLRKHLDDPTLPISPKRKVKKKRVKRPPTPKQLQRRQERKDKFRRRRQLVYTRARAKRRRLGKMYWMRALRFLNRQRILKERAEANARHAEEQRRKAEAAPNRKPTKAQRDIQAAFAAGYAQGVIDGKRIAAETTKQP